MSNLPRSAPEFAVETFKPNIDELNRLGIIRGIEGLVPRYASIGIQAVESVL